MNYVVLGIAMAVVIAVLVVSSLAVNKKNKQLFELKMQLEAEHRRALRAENKLHAIGEAPDEE